MSISINIELFGNAILISEVTEAIRAVGINVRSQPPKFRGGPVPSEVVVALGSVGAFTALFKIVQSILQRDKNREITFKRNDVSITIKGHSPSDEKEILITLAPELLETRE